MPPWLADFASLKWWVSVFIAGIAINMLSKRLDNHLVRSAQGARNWWTRRAARKATERQNARQKMVRKLLENPIARTERVVYCLAMSLLGTGGALTGVIASTRISKSDKSVGLFDTSPNDLLSMAMTVVAFLLFFRCVERIGETLFAMREASRNYSPEKRDE